MEFRVELGLQDFFLYLAIQVFVTFLGIFKWPFYMVVGDLQLGDQKVTLNHLVYIYI